MGQNIFHVGPAGAGQTAKVCNNMLLAVQQIAVGEAFVLAEKLGLSAQSLYDVVTGATGGVGGLAIEMLAQLGYHVVALTGKGGTFKIRIASREEWQAAGSNIIVLIKTIREVTDVGLLVGKDACERGWFGEPMPSEEATVLCDKLNDMYAKVDPRRPFNPFSVIPA